MKKTTDLIRVDYQRSSFGQRVLITATIGWFALLILVPVGSVVRNAFKEGLVPFWQALNTPASQHAFLQTISITVLAVLLNTVFGVILSLVLVKQNFRGKLIFEGLIDLPFAVSPVVAGFMFIILLGPNGWIG
ncbi:sulfate ABC transporter, partial [bacterium]|nr:sulfate ABC transporter [bacterium]